jgi:hypothetical protein
MRRLILLILIFPGMVYAQSEKETNWGSLTYFIGSWQGTGKSKSGVSKIERKYRFVMNEKFIHVTNRSVFEPRGEETSGEVHENMDFYSFDQAREKVILRQFHVEGYVNQYVLDSTSADGKKIVLITESIENISPGWRAKVTKEIVNDDEFIEYFELAPPEKDFFVCNENHFKRKE